MSEKVIFYIVVAIAWGFYNLFLKGKKAANKVKSDMQNTPVAESKRTVSTGDNLEALLGKLLDQNKPTPQPVTKAEVKPMVTPAKDVSSEEYTFDATKFYNDLKREEEKTVEERYVSLESQNMTENNQPLASAIPVVEERAEPTYTNEWLPTGADDIRKAIIWSEIINRPAWAN